MNKLKNRASIREEANILGEWNNSNHNILVDFKPLMIEQFGVRSVS